MIRIGGFCSKLLHCLQVHLDSGNQSKKRAADGQGEAVQQPRLQEPGGQATIGRKGTRVIQISVLRGTESRITQP